jgi:DUF917 family protein
MHRRLAAIVAALTLAVAVVIGSIAAAGFGTFVVNVTGGAQQGSATVTGACQAGEPVTVTFENEYLASAGKFVTTGINLAGINAACTDGILVVNGDEDNPYPFAPVAGVVTVNPPTPYGVGDLDTLNVLLSE